MTNQIRNLAEKKNKQRLLSMLKEKGEYLAFSKNDGFIYLLHIGQADGQNVYIEVALKNGNLDILGTHKEEAIYQLKKVVK